MKPAVVAVALSLACSVFASEVRRGDVFRTGTVPVICPSPPFGALYSSDLTFKQWFATGGAIAFDSIGNLYALDGALLGVFDSTLAKVRVIALPELASSLAVSGAGFAYVVADSGTTYVYSPGGALQAKFKLPNVSLPVQALSIDIAPEGCTLVYGVHADRYDACANLPLPSLAPSEEFTAVRALRDGGFAGATKTHLELFNAAGQRVIDVPLPAPANAFAFDTNPDVVFLALPDKIVKMNIRDQSILAHDFNIYPHSVAVFGEERPSVSGAKRRAARR